MPTRVDPEHTRARRKEVGRCGGLPGGGRLVPVHDYAPAVETDHLVRPSGKLPDEAERGWNREQLTLVGLDQLPPTFMHHPVMPKTEENQIREVGRPAPGPVHKMMARCPGPRSVATRPPTPVVADIEGPPLRRRDHPPGAPDVDNHGVGAEQDASDVAVTGYSLDCFCGDGK